MRIVNAGGIAGTATTMITAVAPGLFAANGDGAGAPAGFFVHVAIDKGQVAEPTSTADASSRLKAPAKVAFGEFLNGTGFRGRYSLGSVSVRVGGVEGDVTFAGAQGSFARTRSNEHPPSPSAGGLW